MPHPIQDKFNKAETLLKKRLDDINHISLPQLKEALQQLQEIKVQKDSSELEETNKKIRATLDDIVKKKEEQESINVKLKGLEGFQTTLKKQLLELDQLTAEKNTKQELYESRAGADSNSRGLNQAKKDFEDAEKRVQEKEKQIEVLGEKMQQYVDRSSDLKASQSSEANPEPKPHPEKMSRSPEDVQKAVSSGVQLTGAAVIGAGIGFIVGGPIGAIIGAAIAATALTYKKPEVINNLLVGTGLVEPKHPSQENSSALEKMQHDMESLKNKLAQAEEKAESAEKKLQRFSDLAAGAAKGGEETKTTPTTGVSPTVPVSPSPVELAIPKELKETTALAMGKSDSAHLAAATASSSPEEGAPPSLLSPPSPSPSLEASKPPDPSDPSSKVSP